MQNTDKQNIEKKNAAEKAAEFVKDGMTIGLGTGSTVFFAVKKLGEFARHGLNFKAVSTSDTTTRLVQSSGIKLISIDDVDNIDLTIDGADEVDNNFNGIKGGGGALLFEKITALYSKKNIWIIDSGKLVNKLGKFPLPVEVIPFGYKRVFNLLKEKKYSPEIRKQNNEIYQTDSGNYILDLHLGEIEDAIMLESELKAIAGIIETGLFINIADTVIIGNENTTEIRNK